MVRVVFLLLVFVGHIMVVQPTMAAAVKETTVADTLETQLLAATMQNNPMTTTITTTTMHLTLDVGRHRDALLAAMSDDVAYPNSAHSTYVDIFGGMDDVLRVFHTVRQMNLSDAAELVRLEYGKPFGLDPPAGYHTPEEIFAEFERLADDHSSIASFFSLTREYDAPFTHDGNEMFAMKISDNVGNDEDEPNVLFVGNHHARELITPELALDTVERLLQGYGSDATITRLIDEHQFYVMFTVNPDGLDYVWTVDDYWRKNRRNNGNGSFGVDLNRNYPFGWDFSCGGSTLTSSETYRGPSAASEPETQTMLAFHEDRRFAKILDMHSYAREVRINYADCATMPEPMNELFTDLARDVADEIDYYTQARSCCTGGHISTGYNFQGALAFLIETGTAFQPPSDDMEEELEIVWPGSFHFFQIPIPVSGNILDAQTRQPVYATFDVPSLNFSHDEQKASHPLNGRYHLWVPAGTWNVSVTADGYGTQHFSLEASDSGSVQDILLS